MRINRPTVNGGTISVSDSDALAALSIDGLPVGTTVWNADVGAFFKLTQSARTAITLDPTDGYDSGTWTFANATFTGFEGCTLLVSLFGADDVFGGAYTIDTVVGPTEVDVTPAPTGATTAPISGSATLFDDALETDVTVSANGTIGVRWVFVVAGGVQSVTGAGVDNSDPDNPVMVAADMCTQINAGNDSITTLNSDAQNLDITGLDGNADGDYEFWFSLVAAASASNVLSFQPENLATNQSGEALGSAGNTPFGADLTIMVFGTNTNAGADATFLGHGYFTSKTGRARLFQALSNYTTAVIIQFQSVVTWSDTTTAITKLRFHSSIALGLKAGSYVRLRRLRNVT